MITQNDVNSFTDLKKLYEKIYVRSPVKTISDSD